MKKILNLREWLNLFGSESCVGCEYNNAVKARCNYKRGYCTRYDEYVRDEKRKNELKKGTQLTIFD